MPAVITILNSQENIMTEELIPITSWDVHGVCPLTPSVELEYHGKHHNVPASFPDRCIICYQPWCVRFARERFQARLLETMIRCDLYEFEYGGKRIGVIQSGIGGPMAALILERLIARGMKYFLNVGTAGFIQTSGIKPGQLVLCTKAVRNDGCSYHYAKPSRYSYPDKELTSTLSRILKQHDITHVAGPTITIDAPYNFPVSKLTEMRGEGVLTAEMEASTVFAVSRFRGTKAAAIFVVSDLTTEDFKWKPKYHTAELAEGFENLFKVCIKTLGAVE